MGTASTKKFVRQNGGQLIEEPALTTSAGAGDAHRIPALNAAGVLDPSIVNAVVASAGAGDAGRVPALDAGGRLDLTVLPTGIGPDVAQITASEALAAGDLVNIWSDGGTAKARKADASSAGKEAHGFVLAAVSSGAAATVYFEGTNTQMSGLTPGPQFLSASTPGLCAGAAPSGAGNVVQPVGVAISATALNFQLGTSITLA